MNTLTKHIFVLHHGWVIIGDTDLTAQTDKEIVVTNTAIIRRWGTTRGLGQLAANGPTSQTILDPCGTVRLHPLAIVLIIDCTYTP